MTEFRLAFPLSIMYTHRTSSAADIKIRKHFADIITKKLANIETIPQDELEKVKKLTEKIAPFEPELAEKIRALF